MPVVLALLACSGEPVVLDPDLRLGTGVSTFVPLSDGDPIVVVFGPQGGYHLDGSLEVQGIDPGNPDDLADPRNPLTTFVVERTDGTVVSGAPEPGTVEYRQGIDASSTPGVYEMVGRRIFLAIEDDAELEGQDLRLSVTVEDADGVVLVDEHTGTAEASPYND